MASLTSRRTTLVAAAATIFAIVATIAAIAIDPRRGLLGYLAAYAIVSTTAMGALVLLLIGYATNARWLSTVRRLQEALVSVFPLLAVLFLPILFGLYELYSWAAPPANLSALDRELLHAKSAWLNPTGFVVRSIIYFAIFIVASEVLRRRSLRRDTVVPTGDPEQLLTRDRVFAAAMIPPVGLALTFAAIDWIMSLEPLWISTMFPVYVFAGGFSASIALLSIVAARYRYALTLTGNHFHALGRMLFAFVVFWVYTAYFQGFLIQIANRPIEVAFYLPRMTLGWREVLIVVVAARFVVPFFLLLPRQPKKRPRYILWISAIVLLGHVLDMAWLVVPSGRVSPSWPELVSLIALVGSCTAFAAWRMRRVPLVPTGDPFLPAGLRYESPT